MWLNHFLGIPFTNGFYDVGIDSLLYIKNVESDEGKNSTSIINNNIS